MERRFEINAEARALLAQINLTPIDYASVSLAQLRASADAFTASLVTPGPHKHSDHAISLDGREIMVRRYQGGVSPEQGALVYFHGGGWAMNGLASCDALCEALAASAEISVFSVDYPLAPETRYPSLLIECAKVVEALRQDAGALGVDPTRLAVGGDSAGGNIAAALSHRFLDRAEGHFAAQLLIYPVLDRRTDDPGFTRLGRGYLLDSDGMEWCWRQYLGDLDPGDDPFISPLRARSFADLPPTLVLSASHCPLTHQGTQYVSALRSAGVDAAQAIFPSIHGFAQFAGRWPVADAAVRTAGQFLAQHLCMASGDRDDLS